MDIGALFGSTAKTESIRIFCFVITGFFAVITIGLLTILSRQPKSPKKLSFKVPLVPWIPILSVAVNTYLMLNLPGATWKRFALWMAIGFFIYFGYGMWQSTGYMSEEERTQYHYNKKLTDDEYDGHGRVVPPPPQAAAITTTTQEDGDNNLNLVD